MLTQGLKEQDTDQLKSLSISRDALEGGDDSDDGDTLEALQQMETRQLHLSYQNSKFMPNEVFNGCELSSNKFEVCFKKSDLNSYMVVLRR